MEIGKYIDAISMKTKTVIGCKKNDYVEGGILYCGSCHTPKQVKIRFGGDEKIVFCLCKCAEERMQKEEELKNGKDRKVSIKSLRINGIRDIKARRYSFSIAEDTPNIQKCKMYVEKWDEMYKNNNGLLFWGSPGCGKTFAAGCIANALIDQNIPTLVTSFPRILNSFHDKSAVIESMRKFDLVVIDDLGVERQSEYALETVYMVIDERYKADKPMIITTNLQYSEMENPKNIEYARIYDRILGVCVPVFFGEGSRRKKQGKDKLKNAREIFDY